MAICRPELKVAINLWAVCQTFLSRLWNACLQLDQSKSLLCHKSSITCLRSLCLKLRPAEKRKKIQFRSTTYFKYHAYNTSSWRRTIRYWNRFTTVSAVRLKVSTSTQKIGGFYLTRGLNLLKIEEFSSWRRGEDNRKLGPALRLHPQYDETNLRSDENIRREL